MPVFELTSIGLNVPQMGMENYVVGISQQRHSLSTRIDHLLSSSIEPSSACVLK